MNLIIFSFQLIGTGPYAKVEAVTVKSNAHIKKMVSVQKKTKKRKSFNSYNENNNLQRHHPKPKVVSAPKPLMQSKSALQPLMGTRQILKPQNNSNHRQVYNQSSAPQYYSNPNSYQQTHNFQNGYQHQQQYVPQQYMNPQPYYGQQQHLAHVYNPQVFQSQIQGHQNFNNVELMRIRQIIQAELYYLRTQNESSYYRNFY